MEVSKFRDNPFPLPAEFLSSTLKFCDEAQEPRLGFIFFYAALTKTLQFSLLDSRTLWSLAPISSICTSILRAVAHAASTWQTTLRLQEGMSTIRTQRQTAISVSCGIRIHC